VRVGAYDAATVDPPVRDRRAEMWAALAHGHYLAVIAVDNHTNAANLCSPWLPIEVRERQRRCPLVSRAPER
jgi:hypothetical protein